MTKEYNELEHNPKTAWEIYSSDAHQEAMHKLADRYMRFISHCKTEWETVAEVENMLRTAGFGDDPASGMLVRSFKGKTLFAARRGRRPLAEGLRLIASHGDTPRVDFKQHPLYEDAAVAQAKTHYYGGLRKHQWFSLPLALHGHVVKESGESVSVVLGEQADDPVFAIADLLPHLAQKQATQKLSEAFSAEKMNIIMGHQPLMETGRSEGKGETQEEKKSKNPIKAHVLHLLNQRFGIREEDLYSAELHAVPAGPARYVGLDRAMIGGYGQDDRSCVFLSLAALLEQAATGPAPEYTQCLVIWDKEEVGSEGATGAKSRFFEYCVEELLAHWEPETHLRQVMLASKALSADVHGAFDPDYQELHEKLNAAFLGNGPCFTKFTGSRGKYEANDAHPAYIGWLRRILNQAGIPWQMAELGKVDQGGGGTVAMYLGNYGMDVIDCGPAVLAMHSPFELTSVADIYATYQAFKIFFES